MQIGSVGTGNPGSGSFLAGPLLSGPGGNQNDTAAGTVVRGDLIAGNSTPAWQRLARGATGQTLTVTAGGDIAWIDGISMPGGFGIFSALGSGLRMDAISKFDTSVNLPAGAFLAFNSSSVSTSGDTGFVKSAASGGNFSAFYDNVEFDRMTVTARRFLRSSVPGAFAAITDALPVARFGGNNKVNTTPVGNGADNTEDTLITYNLPVSLTTNGDRTVIETFGSFAANATLKRVRLYFGGTVVFDTGSKAFNGTDWSIRATVIRTGAATQVATGFFCGDVALVTVTSQSTAPAETLAGVVTIKTTGQCTATGAANDILNKGLVVDVFPVGA